MIWLFLLLFYCFLLFVDSVYSYIKDSFFACKVCSLIIIREGNGYFYFISRMCAYQLVFKIINITSRSNLKICTLAICASTIKCCSVDLTDIIDIYSIPIFDSKGSICAVCSCFFCSFRCLSSFLCCFFCGLRCCCCYGIFVVILDLKSLEDFLVYSNICIFQPFVCGFCI